MIAPGSDSPHARALETNCRPQWWSLGWNPENPGFAVRIRRNLLDGDDPVEIPGLYVASLMDELVLASFSLMEGQLFGFDGAAVQLPDDAGSPFRVFSVPVPLLNERIGPCPRCGTRKEEDERCSACGDTGFDTRINFARAHAITASLSVMFRMMEFPACETDSSFSQGMEILTHCSGGDYGIRGVVALPMQRWLNMISGCGISEAMEAMLAAYETMHGLSGSPGPRGFNAAVSAGGRLHLSCPGMAACGIDPTQFSLENEGYRFVSHGEDSPLQQIVLLAGLAAVWDLYEMECRRIGEIG